MRVLTSCSLALGVAVFAFGCVDQSESCAEEPDWVYRVDVLDDVDPRSDIAYLAIEINGSGLTDVVRTYTPRGDATTMAFPFVEAPIVVQEDGFTVTARAYDVDDNLVATGVIEFAPPELADECTVPNIQVQRGQLELEDA